MDSVKRTNKSDVRTCVLVCVRLGVELLLLFFLVVCMCEKRGGGGGEEEEWEESEKWRRKGGCRTHTHTLTHEIKIDIMCQRRVKYAK